MLNYFWKHKLVGISTLYGQSLYIYTLYSLQMIQSCSTVIPLSQMLTLYISKAELKRVAENRTWKIEISSSWQRACCVIHYMYLLRNIFLFYRICNIQCEIIRGHAKGATFAKRLGTVWYYCQFNEAFYRGPFYALLWTCEVVYIQSYSFDWVIQGILVINCILVLFINSPWCNKAWHLSRVCQENCLSESKKYQLLSRGSL